MNYKVRTPCEKFFPGCYGDKPRVYADKEAARARCHELNEIVGQEPGLVGTFHFVETAEQPEVVHLTAPSEVDG